MLVNLSLGLLLASSTLTLAAAPYRPTHRSMHRRQAPSPPPSNNSDNSNHTIRVNHTSPLSLPGPSTLSHNGTTTLSHNGTTLPAQSSNNFRDCDNDGDMGDDGGSGGNNDNSDGNNDNNSSDENSALFCSNNIATTPSSVAPGSLTGPEGCTAWTEVQTGDTCNSILNATGSTLSLTGFLNANAGISASTCNNLLPGQSVCTAGPKLLQFGSADNNNGCLTFYCVVKNDDCIVVANKLGNLTSVALLEQLNPEIGQQCLNMWLGSWICAAGTYSSVVSS